MLMLLKNDMNPFEETASESVTAVQDPAVDTVECAMEVSETLRSENSVEVVYDSSEPTTKVPSPVSKSNIENSIDSVTNLETKTGETASETVTSVYYPDYNFVSPSELVNTGSLFTPDQYLESCKWSPDGSCLLTCCADSRLRLFDLPSQLYSLTETTSETTLDGPLKPSLVVSENGSIYDFEWYPFMSSWAPETACFISASSSAPVHLIDAFTGNIRASYTGYNNVFEVTSCFGLTFSFDGVKILCGYRNMIKIFDIDVPGTNSHTIQTKRLNEQTGYISCIAQNPSFHSLFAAGSFSRTIGLYTFDGDAVCLLKGQRNGLTSLVYSNDGTKLFSAGRMDPEILCWDLRNPGQVLYVFKRVMETNQRIRISLSADGRHLLSGGTDGIVRIWALSQLENGELPSLEPTFTFKAHNDCVNGVSLNAKYPVLATSSGKRHVPDIVSDEESDQTFSFVNFSKKTENRVSVWWTGPKKDQTLL